MAFAPKVGVSASMAGTKRIAGDTLTADNGLSCGICLAEVDDQGCLDSCQHVYCFECIMKWSQVESRCPTCKRRFKRVTRASADANRRGNLRQPRSFNIPLKDQVYHPSEEELAVAMEPYAHTVCLRCLECDNEHLLLLCDVCDNAAHTYCVGLGHAVPEGDWFCDACAGTAGASTSGSDTSVSVGDLGESTGGSSDENEDEGGSMRTRGTAGHSAALSDGDSEAEFRLDVHFDAQPRGSGASGRVPRVLHSGRARGSQGAAAGRVRTQARPTRRTRGGLAERLPLPLGARASEGGGVGGQTDGRGTGGRGRRSREGTARTLQGEVGARLQLQLVRDSWADIQAGTRSFPPRTAPPLPRPPSIRAPATPSPSASAGVPSHVEQMAWKALRALQSGQAGRTHSCGATEGDADKRDGTQLCTAAPGTLLKRRGAKAAQSRRPKELSSRGVVSSAGTGRGRGRGRVGPPIAAVPGVDGNGPPASGDVFEVQAVSRRQANAGWADDELLEDTWQTSVRGKAPIEVPSGWGRNDSRGTARAVVKHDWRSGRAGIPGEAMPMRSGGPWEWQQQQQQRRGACTDAALGSTSISAPLGSSVNDRSWPEVPQAEAADSLPMLSQHQPRPCLAPLPLPSGGEGHLPGMPQTGTRPMWGPAQAGRGAPGEGRVDVNGREAARGGMGAEEHTMPRVVVSDSARESSELRELRECGMAAAKRVKDRVAEAVKQQLEPLYRNNRIDRLQFRKAAEGTTRALLQAPLAQALYADMKRGINGTANVNSGLLCWGCRQSIGGSGRVGLPFCRTCIECQMEAQVKLVGNPT